MKKTTNINPWTPAKKSAGQKLTKKHAAKTPTGSINSVNEQLQADPASDRRRESKEERII